MAAKRLVNVSKISYFEMGSAANCMSVKYWQVNRNAKTGGILLATGVLTAQRVLGGSVLMNQPPDPRDAQLPLRFISAAPIAAAV
ncbi:MAG: hypothetical protein ABSF34_17455, partial [Verrucomicrobiota bacterium]